MSESDKVAHNKKLITEAARDGRTIDEIIKYSKIKLEKRRLQDYIKKMVEEGSLVDLNEGDMGPGKVHHYIPAEQVRSKIISENIEEAPKEEEEEIEVPEPVIDARAEDAKRTILEINKEIMKDRAWTDKRRVKTICLGRIRPLIYEISLLRSDGYVVEMPWEYFKPERIESWKRTLTYQYVEGRLSIPIIDERVRIYSDGKRMMKMKRNDLPYDSGTMEPSLLEWRDYLERVYEVLLKERGHKMRREVIIEMGERKGIVRREEKVIIGPESDSFMLMKKIQINGPWFGTKNHGIELTREENELDNWLRDAEENMISIGERRINIAGSCLMLMRLTRTGMISYVFSAYVLQEIEPRRIDLEKDEARILELNEKILPILMRLTERGLLEEKEGELILTGAGEKMADSLMSVNHFIIPGDDE